MKILHFSNSFLLVRTADAAIVCDPWVGVGNHGGWHSIPEFNEADLISSCRGASHVYISHLHSDHFDPAFLKRAELVAKTYLIKKFADGVLRKRLESLGVENIVEIEPWTNFKLTARTAVAIFPQMTSNSAEADDKVNYDLDTSIAIHSDHRTFFNQVDNPLSNDNYKEIKKFISAHYGEINLACFTCGAAGEYPQCFLNVDRAAEKERIIGSSLEKLERAVTTLAPQSAFIAGGSYFIPGKFSGLNRFIAQPTFAQMKDRIQTYTETFLIEGGKQVDIDGDRPVATLCQVILPLYPNFHESIMRHEKDLYDHEGSEAVTVTELISTFARAKEKYQSKMARLGIQLSREIVFKIYADLNVTAEGVVTTQPIATLRLEAGASTAVAAQLVIHLDDRAAYRCLTRKAIWNQTLSGSLCLFERTPNTFEPEVLFSLNFLTV